MAKRSAEDIDDGNQAYLKRQKISSVGTKAPGLAEEIRSARQLRQILAFDQDAGRSKHGRKIMKHYE
jgi:nucleolar pre-ribosomal-associated protein 1